MIKTIQSAIRSKQSKRYGQEYDQDKPRGGYIVGNIYTKAKNLSKGLIPGGCKKINNRAISNSIC